MLFNTRCHQLLKHILDLAKGSKSVRVPWKKIADEPSQFYDVEFLPPGIQIRDPSKMVKDHIETCFRMWMRKEAKGRQPFQFRQVYSSQRGYQLGCGRIILNSDSDSDSAAPRPGQRYEKAKAPSPYTSGGSDDEQDEDKSDRPAKKAKILRSGVQNNGSEASDEDGHVTEQDTGKKTKDKSKRSLQTKSGRTKRSKKGEGKKAALDFTDQDNGDEQRPDVGPDAAIDPILQLQSRMYPTYGPNDDVPPGCIPMPFINLSKPTQESSGAKTRRAVTRSQHKMQQQAASPEHGDTDGGDAEANNTKKRKRSAPEDKTMPDAKAGRSKPRREAVGPKAKKARVAKVKVSPCATLHNAD
jgi:hypothetical protein